MIKNIDLKEIGKYELRQCINRKDEQNWKEDMQNKDGLKYYRKQKKHMEESRMWQNNNNDRIIRSFHSNSLLLNDKISKTADKKCMTYNQAGDINHFLI